MVLIALMVLIILIAPYPLLSDSVGLDILFRGIICVLSWFAFNYDLKIKTNSTSNIPEKKVVAKEEEKPKTTPSNFKIDFSSFKKSALQIDSLSYLKKVSSEIVQYAASQKITLKPTKQFRGLAVNELHFSIQPNIKVVKGEEQVDIPKVTKVESLVRDVQRVIGGVEGVTFIPIIKDTADIGFAIPSTKNNKANIRLAFESEEYVNAAWILNKYNQNLALPILAGYSAKGNLITFDMTKAVHLIVAGTTGFGKSTQLNSIIAGLLAAHGPDTLKFAMIDIKRVELSQYSNLPHLYSPIVQEVEDAIALLNNLTKEMDRRYKILESVGVKKLEEFNKKIKKPEQFMPPIIVIVDEVAELLMDTKKKDSNGQSSSELITTSLVRLAQLGRAAGIHLILATQRPSAEVLDGRLRSNIPSRIAFKTVTAANSKIILDESGDAVNLARQGDGLLKLPTEVGLERFQGVIAEDKELTSIIRQSGG